MMKKHKVTLLVTTLVTLSPMLVGLLLWNQLPDVIATHFNADNVANGWSSKVFAVFGIPAFLAAMQFICAVITSHDPKKANISDKMFRLILWIIPICSLLTCLSCYVTALGYDFNIGMIINIFMGILFIIIGNYMHKVKQNYTVGIKIPWTLSSVENWNRTHRMAAWLWILGGIVFIINSFILSEWVLALIIPCTVVLPMLYSFILYKKGI